MLILLSYFTIIISAILYSNVIEWIAHKYILHGLGKNKKSPWAFHWHQHHNKARKNKFYDDDYLNGWQGPALREKIGLFSLLVLHTPIVFYYPLFFLILVYCSFRYYKIHKYAHLHPSWAQHYLRCHYDHHMGDNQNANWGVTVEWVDRLLGTRINYYNLRCAHVGK